jgi:UDP-N-acetylmuramoylalanine--D-glutamate ligase
MIDLGFLAGHRVDVLGLGRTGLAAAAALARSGALVRVWDDAPAARAEAAAAGLAVDEGVGGRPAEMLVMSPGIPHTHPAPHPAAARAKADGVQISGDVELLWRARPHARYVAITGTNGKSTTTALIGHVLAAAGRRVAVGGNLGTPVLSLPALGEDGIYVLELSSYQLELLPAAAFDVAVLLNVSPDHLDRHGGMDGYVAAKARIFDGDRPGAVAVVGVEDDRSAAIRGRLAAAGARRVVPIDSRHVATRGVFALDGVLYDDERGDARRVMDLSGVPTLPGAHNHQNACAAYAACRAVGVEPEAVAAAIATYPGLAHRQELAASAAGVRFVNDSKATNADAAAKALGCYRDIYWIAGGVPKAGGLSGLEGFMPRVRRAFLIGQAAEDFRCWLAGKAPATVCGDLEAATRAAFAAARAGGRPDPVVLLSPACASFDQFRSFEHRGDVFRDLARTIAAEEGRAA